MPNIMKPDLPAGAAEGARLANLVPGRYHFNLERFQIFNTRAPHLDHDVVAVWVKVGDQPVKSHVVAVGDVNNGVHVVNAKLGPIAAADRERVTFGFSIVNAGHKDWSAVEQKITQGVATVADIVVPEPFAELARLFVEAIGAIFDVDCDGVVAIDQHIWPGRQLREITTAHNPFEVSHTYFGTDSSVGCGSNSNYVVTWRVSKDPES